MDIPQSMDAKMDPCLQTNNGDDEIYVNNRLTIGTDQAIKEVINALKRHAFGLKVQNNRTDCLSCKMIQHRDQEKAWVIQPYLIDNLAKKFGDEVS